MFAVSKIPVYQNRKEQSPADHKHPFPPENKKKKARPSRLT